MAVDSKPSTWIASWSADSTNVTLPIASVPELSAAEAHATTGDMRKVWYALNAKLFAAYNALASADRPTKMTVLKSVSVNPATSETTVTFTNIFTCTEGSVEVVAE